MGERGRTRRLRLEERPLGHHQEPEVSLMLYMLGEQRQQHPRMPRQ